MRGVGPLLLAFSKGSFLLLFPLHWSSPWTRQVRGGGGAVLHPHRVSGVWSKEEVFDHINTLELKAVLLALQNLESLVVGHLLLIRSGYMTVVSFIIFQGGILSLSLCRLALDLWEWCLWRRIFLHAAHIPGEEYFVDFLSRG